jgi:streptogramin lyase
MSVLRSRAIHRVHPGKRSQRHQTTRLACLTVFVIAAMLGILPEAASAASGFTLSSVAKPHAACSESSSAGNATCEAIAVPTVAASSAEAIGPELEGSGELGGFDPKDLHEAYKLPETGGLSTTVAIVDAFNDPYAESDLQKYREKYKVYFKGTETACTEANGCFKKVNQKGETANYPENSSGWSAEISLDIDTVSAACAECKILLVEASGEGISNLGASDEEAEKLGASVISNSWNEGFEGPEAGEINEATEKEDNKYFDHESVPILFAGGDYGYSVRYPAVSQYVIAVGGTRLKKESESSRKWSEEVWSNTSYGYRVKGRGTGSGCSKYEAKPKWQTDKACTHRIQNDVAAVAAPESPVSVYDTYEGGWANYGGTSASSPFVAGVEGLSTSHARSLGADAFYVARGSLFDVTKGSDGTCTPPAEDEYFCTALTGYDGPTGNGTPDGAILTPPSATTEAAIEISKTAADLKGSVNPEGAETKYYFEYGNSETYGSTTSEASAGSGTGNVKVSKPITHLTAGTKYDFRIVATNSNKETSYGGNQAFTTVPNAPENITLPVASPTTPDQGVPEASTTGTWTNEPTSFTYQWELCNATGGECTSISGATSATFTPTEADAGHTLVVKVTASNQGGSNSAPSTATNKVEPIGKITEYSVSHIPGGVTAGPDGNLWFTEPIANKVAKMTTSGTVSEYALPEKSEPLDIAPGPDGDLWFTDAGTSKIGKISTTGTVTEYSLPAGSKPYGIVAGPSKENDLWFTDQGTGKIGKISTAGAITEFALPEKSTPWGIAVGSDGNLWFSGWVGSKVGKVTTVGLITEYSTPKSEPKYITAGPDGNLWFTYSLEAKVGKITTSGTVTEYALPEKSYPEGIATGADGNLWVADEDSSKLSRITTSGTITAYSLPAKSEPLGITSGPDDNLWFTETGTLKIGKITP